jgi:hypothetical protein
MAFLGQKKQVFGIWSVWVDRTPPKKKIFCSILARQQLIHWLDYSPPCSLNSTCRVHLFEADLWPLLPG